MDTTITGVAFGQDQIQIQYLEQARQGTSGGIEETLTLDMDEKTLRLTAEIKEALVEIIDQFKLSLRNPPEQLGTGLNRFMDDDD